VGNCNFTQLVFDVVASNVQDQFVAILGVRYVLVSIRSAAINDSDPGNAGILPASIVSQRVMQCVLRIVLVRLRANLIAQ
jgi:hypothetical protein